MEQDENHLSRGNQGQLHHEGEPSTSYNEEFLSALESLMNIEANAIELNPGDKPFRQNAPMEMFYLILDGCCKVSHVDPTGCESVVDFYYSHEFVGLDSMGEKTYANTAEAITLSRVKGFASASINNNLFKNSPLLEHYFWGLMGEEITAARKRVCMHKLSTSEQKLAAFLMTQLESFGNSCPTPLYMPMARQDIASYLGMSPETLSRLFARFEADGLIRVTNRHVEIISHEGLTALLDKNTCRIACDLL